ncbi:Na(+) H(+) antiporter subunit B [hydrothermal vent metagenome]|uniref:Na(+) H(+) antiporter subunit B n=1 Tax=hydrothermal vent metagenome TaxID=652676 RepID=A0A3B0Y112_9ZZZZ
MKHHLVLRVVTKLLIPMIILFAFYVQFHGDYGPGGGFQAGVIFASAFILHGLVFGVAETQKVISPGILKATAALGVLLYAGTGLASMFFGGEFLNYSTLAATPVKGQHLGILLVELGVGITVASIMLSFFYIFSEQQKPQNTGSSTGKKQNTRRSKTGQFKKPNTEKDQRS